MISKTFKNYPKISEDNVNHCEPAAIGKILLGRYRNHVSTSFPFDPFDPASPGIARHRPASPRQVLVIDARSQVQDACSSMDSVPRNLSELQCEAM